MHQIKCVLNLQVLAAHKSEITCEMRHAKCDMRNAKLELHGNGN